MLCVRPYTFLVYFFRGSFFAQDPPFPDSIPWKIVLVNTGLKQIPVPFKIDANSEKGSVCHSGNANVRVTKLRRNIPSHPCSVRPVWAIWWASAVG